MRTSSSELRWTDDGRLISTDPSGRVEYGVVRNDWMNLRRALDRMPTTVTGSLRHRILYWYISVRSGENQVSRHSDPTATLDHVSIREIEEHCEAARAAEIAAQRDALRRIGEEGERRLREPAGKDIPPDGRYPPMIGVLILLIVFAMTVYVGWHVFRWVSP